MLIRRYLFLEGCVCWWWFVVFVRLEERDLWMNVSKMAGSAKR